MTDTADSDGLTAEVLIVGAGIAGLSCARALDERDVDVRVLEKSRGVGGRCATRRIEGQPVDHGLSFYHGDDAGFLLALRSVESETPRVWPRRIVGEGAPCQPRAFSPGQQRWAFAGGVSLFPKHLARGIVVDLETRATRIEVRGDRLALTTESGKCYQSRSLVLTLPAGQTLDLLRGLPASSASDVAAVSELLKSISMVRCLTAIAGYPASVPLPEWEVCYPHESEVLQLISQDSTKRPAPAWPLFVFQARPGWSARHWDAPPAVWTEALLAAAGAVCGDWVTRPSWTDTQRWRYARLSGGDGLTAPLLVRLDNGSRIGITGEAMAGGGGVQGAWLAGRQMAGRLLGDEGRQAQ